MAAGTFMSQYLVAEATGGSSWVYRFPNGCTASVVPDRHRPFRFEVQCVDPANTSHGGVFAGLSTAEVEARLVAICNFPS